MKTLLVLAKESGLASAIRAVLDAERYRIVSQADAREAEPLLRQGTVDGCILDADLTSIQPIRAIEQLRRQAPVGGCTLDADLPSIQPIRPMGRLSRGVRNCPIFV